MLKVVKTENGLVRGLPGNNTRITVFKGIPFAAPPVGKNRWRAPQPAADWEGIRDCYTFGPISMQDTPSLGTDIYCREWHVDPEIPMDPFMSGSSEAVSSGVIRRRWSSTERILPREALYLSV